MMRIDHVVAVVADAAAAADELRDRHGLGSEQGAFLPFAGTRGYNVPLEPPEYVELLAIEDPTVAATSISGRTALARAEAGYGLFAWAVLVDDLEAISARVGIEIFDFTISHPDGTLRGWRAVSGPEHLPFFIDYPNNGDRIGRWKAMYDRVDHSCSPGGFVQLTISGSAAEMSEWLGEHDLPLRFVDGNDGILEARISTSRGDVVIH